MHAILPTTRNPGANPARLPDTLRMRMELVPGWQEFLADVGVRAQLTSTPGWENGEERTIETERGPVSMPHKSRPGAKAIGLAQWGVAISVAAIFADIAPEAELPYADADPDGSIVLTWAFTESLGLTLTLHSSLLRQTYEWTQLLDGTPRKFTAVDPMHVIESLRTVARAFKASGAKRIEVPR